MQTVALAALPGGRVLPAAELRGIVLLAADRRASSWPLQVIFSILVRRRLGGSVLSAGRLHTCADTSQNGLVCFGDDGYVQCAVPADLGPVVAVAASRDHTCIVTSQNELVCFGPNVAGQCAVPADLGPVVAQTAARPKQPSLREACSRSSVPSSDGSSSP